MKATFQVGDSVQIVSQGRLFPAANYRGLSGTVKALDAESKRRMYLVDVPGKSTLWWYEHELTQTEPTVATSEV